MYTDLIFADAHVKRRPDEHYALEQLVDAAINNQVIRVIGLGDLLDRQSNRSEPVTFFHKQISRLAHANIEFCYIQGNHDSDSPAWLSGHDNATHLHKQRLATISGVFYGLDFQHAGQLQEALQAIPREATYLVAHQGWSEWQGEDRNPQGSFADVPGHITKVFTGDLHALKMKSHVNAVGLAMKCYSPGAAAAQKITEPSRHHYFLMDDDGRVTSHELHSRCYLEATLMTQEDVDKFLANLGAELAEAKRVAYDRGYPGTMVLPYLYITYAHHLSDVPRRVEKLAADKALLYWKELPPLEKQKASTVVFAGEGVITPLTVLPTVVDRTKKPEVFDLTSRLLTDANPQEAFKAWWQEQIGAAVEPEAIASDNEEDD